MALHLARRALLFGTASCAAAQLLLAQTQSPPLSDFTGLYEYHGGTTLALVPDPPGMIVIIDEAKYPLRAAGRDRFTNNGGDTIPFQRDPGGKVVSFNERGVVFKRLADTVSRSAALVVAARLSPGGARTTAYSYSPPPKRDDGLAVGDIAGAGIDRAVAERIVGRVLDRTYPDVDAILVYRHGRLVMEEYFYGYDESRIHALRSATKSVISALAGAAIDRGALSGVEELVLPRLENGSPGSLAASLANSDPRKARLTLRDLLSMRSGFACDDWNPKSPGNESRLYETGDWVKSLLDLPLAADPGSVGSYCSVGMLTAGRIVERAVGMSLPSFAREALWEPLGISSTQAPWNFTLDRSNAGSFAQIRMRPRDMLKFGVLFLNGGQWNGKTVLSKAWTQRSTDRVTRIGSRGYGYGWWLQDFDVNTGSANTARVTAIAASGNGGQKIYVLPSLDAVVVFTGSFYNADRDSPPNEIMAAHLLPAMLRSR
jgi:CubicO group peptidase (beta-lactamase class C family)